MVEATTDPSAAYTILSRWVSQHRRILALTLVAFAISYAFERVRFALFGPRISWEVTLLLAPFQEDSLKLGLVLYFLSMATLVTGILGPAHGSKTNRATRVMLVLFPLFAGGILALFEPPLLNRFLGHTASVGLGFAVCLFSWRRWKTLGGFVAGLGSGALVHSFLNTAYYWPVAPTGGYQFAAALGLLVASIWILRHAARQEPASDVAREFFPSRTDRADASPPIQGS